MKKIAEELIDMCEMANFRQKHTGLPMVIWIQAKSGNEKHGPRIKVQTNHSNAFNLGNTVSVTITDEPMVIGQKLNNKDYELVKEFIKINRQALEDVWNGKIDTIEFIEQMKKVQP